MLLLVNSTSFAVILVSLFSLLTKCQAGKENVDDFLLLRREPSPLPLPLPLPLPQVGERPSLLHTVEQSSYNSMNDAIDRRKPGIAHAFANSLNPHRNAIQHIGDTTEGLLRLGMAGVAGARGAVKGVGRGIREEIRLWAEDNRGTRMYKRAFTLVRRGLGTIIKERAKHCIGECSAGAREAYHKASEGRRKAWDAGYERDNALRRGDIHTAQQKSIDEKTGNRAYVSHMTSIPGKALSRGAKALISPIPGKSPAGSPSSSMHSSSSRSSGMKRAVEDNVNENVPLLVRRANVPESSGENAGPIRPTKFRGRASQRAKACVGECKAAFKHEIERSQDHATNAANLKLKQSRALLDGNTERAKRKSFRAKHEMVKAYGRMLNAPVQGALHGAKALLSSDPIAKITNVRPSVIRTNSGSSFKSANAKTPDRSPGKASVGASAAGPSHMQKRSLLFEWTSDMLLRRSPGIGNAVVKTLQRSKSVGAMPSFGRSASNLSRSASSLSRSASSIGKEVAHGGGKGLSNLSPNAKVGMATTAVAMAGAVASNIHIAPPPVTLQVSRQGGGRRGRRTSMQTTLGEGAVYGNVGGMNLHMPTSRFRSFGRGEQ